MPIRKMLGAALPALALAGIVACQSEAPADRPLVSSQEEYKSVGEVPFLYDNEGKVVRQAPLAVLKDVHSQLAAGGQENLAKGLASVYDFTTGEVKDFRAAERAEAYLMANLSKLEAPAAVVEAPKAITAADLPAGITIPQELVQALGMSASKGGVK